MNKINNLKISLIALLPLAVSACTTGGFIKQAQQQLSYQCDTQQELHTISYDDDTMELNYANRQIVLSTQHGGAKQLYSNKYMLWFIKGTSGELYSVKQNGERGGRVTKCEQLAAGANFNRQNLPQVAAEPRQPEPAPLDSNAMPETLQLPLD